MQIFKIHCSSKTSILTLSLWCRIALTHQLQQLLHGSLCPGRKLGQYIRELNSLLFDIITCNLYGNIVGWTLGSGSLASQHYFLNKRANESQRWGTFDQRRKLNNVWARKTYLSVCRKQNELFSVFWKQYQYNNTKNSQVHLVLSIYKPHICQDLFVKQKGSICITFYFKQLFVTKD